MPSFEIKKGTKKPSGSGPSLPQTGETKVLPKDHPYRQGAINVRSAYLLKAKKGFDGRA